jgi:RNase P protein component
LHLVLCKWCRRYGKQIRFLRAAAREHHEALAGASSRKLDAAARERIKRRLRENQ